jgi:hypothetical protein
MHSSAAIRSLRSDATGPARPANAHADESVVPQRSLAMFGWRANPGMRPPPCRASRRSSERPSACAWTAARVRQVVAGIHGSSSVGSATADST